MKEFAFSLAADVATVGGLGAAGRAGTTARVVLRVSQGIEAGAVVARGYEAYGDFEAGRTAEGYAHLGDAFLRLAGLSASQIGKLREVAKAKVVAGEAASLASELTDGARLVSLAELRHEVQLLKNGTCFVAGTPLLTADGSKPIDKFIVGDTILSRPENDRTAPLRSRRVEAVFALEAEIVELHLGGRKIGTTSEHPLFVEGYGWRRVADLMPGDLIVGHDERRIALTEVVKTGRVEKVYNLRVADDHTYFVGDPVWGFTIWAHNAYTIRASASVPGTWDVIDDFNKAVRTSLATEAEAIAFATRHNGAGLKAVVPLLEKSGMRATETTAENGTKVWIVGQVERSSSISQAPAAVAQFDAMVKSAEYEYVIGQRSMRRALGLEELGKAAGDDGKLIPDIIGIRKDGTIDIYEIASKSDLTRTGLRDLDAKIARIKDAMPVPQQGDIRIIKPPYSD